ncbi:hypothetical protein EVAR_81426_1 [Eumeta japonica]|uniref:Uncharacterized protein n=1 Tax=Eumeta variegata TaxID=151549 RepID=A0A4C1W219_EUMVA|nr:hypothetical protein EVAR_81426_1 [Eumeta japonica]
MDLGTSVTRASSRTDIPQAVRARTRTRTPSAGRRRAAANNHRHHHCDDDMCSPRYETSLDYLYKYQEDVGPPLNISTVPSVSRSSS